MCAVYVGLGWRVLMPALCLLSLLQPVSGISSEEGELTFTKILEISLYFCCNSVIKICTMLFCFGMGSVGGRGVSAARFSTSKDGR